MTFIATGREIICKQFPAEFNAMKQVEGIFFPASSAEIMSIRKAHSPMRSAPRRLIGEVGPVAELVGLRPDHDQRGPRLPTCAAAAATPIFTPTSRMMSHVRLLKCRTFLLV
jgi:hypothetical protein